MPIVESDAAIREILATARTIAVVGLSDKPWRDSFSVTSFMKAQGYTIIPVNPNIASVFGMTAVPSLREAGTRVDIVNVFRRPEHVDDIVDAALGIAASTLWLQTGIVNETASLKASEGGMNVVSDRCIRVAYTLLMR